MFAVKQSDARAADYGWKPLYRAGALSAGLIFLNVLIDISVTMLPGQSEAKPGSLSARDWLAVLQAKPLLGLRNLGLLNVANMLLSVPLFAALVVAHRRTRGRIAALAASVQLVGAAVYVANNKALSMRALSQRYAAAAGDHERSIVVAAGEAQLAQGEDFTPGSFPGLFLSGLANMLIGLVVLRGGLLGHVTGWAGVLGPGSLLIFTAWATFGRSSFGPAIALAAGGGLVSLAWYALLARGLVRLAT
jgi:hypothetical protein